MKNIFNNKRFKHGSLATVMTVGLVVLVVLVNILASMIADRLPVNIDLTSNKLYELTADTTEYLKDMDSEIKIELFATEEDFKNLGSTYGFSEFSAPALELIKKYGMYDNITVEYLDPYTNPDVISKYPDANLGLGSIVVSCEDRYRVLGLTDILSLDMQTGYVTGLSLENAVTSSIMVVSNANPTKITLLTGINGGDVSGLTNLLTNNGYELETTDILTGEISEDTEILILVSPMNDLPENALSKIDDYLENASEYKRNFYYFADPSQPKLPNIEAFLAEWGIAVGNSIVAETNQNLIYNNNIFFITQNFADGFYGDKIGNHDGYMYFVQYRPIEQLFEENSNRTTKVLLSSYPSTIAVPFDADENWQYTESDMKSYPSIVMGERSVYDSDKGVQLTSNVVVFGSATVADSTFTTQSLFKNAEYLTVMSNELCGREDVNVVAPKTTGIKTLGISSADRDVIVAIFQYILPVLIIIMGIVVWIRRRNR